MMRTYVSPWFCVRAFQLEGVSSSPGVGIRFYKVILILVKALQNLENLDHVSHSVFYLAKLSD